MNKPIVFMRPGDLHLIDRESLNFKVAQWMIAEANGLVKPDFVQFAGDNVQDAEPNQFEIFCELAGGLQVPWRAMPGDHDVVEDPSAKGYRSYIGKTYDSFDLQGFRFVQLNTCEDRPVGFSDTQLDWFEQQLQEAVAVGLKVIVFQHHYPFKVCESFAGTGVERWREITRRYRIEAILTGHTHYGQKANDGLNISVATRSIGDPEGGPGGYHVFYCEDGPRSALACAYREYGAAGPLLLITAPREMIFSRGGADIATGPITVEALVWSKQSLNVSARIDDGPEFPLTAREGSVSGASAWSGRETRAEPLKKGVHRLSVRAQSADGAGSVEAIEFIYDETGRYTALPMLDPRVELTEYC